VLARWARVQWKRIRCGHDCFRFDRGQLPGADLTTAAVVDAFDPGELAICSSSRVSQRQRLRTLLLQQTEEALRGGVFCWRCRARPMEPAMSWWLSARTNLCFESDCPCRCG
jgi:hypothetical protein